MTDPVRLQTIKSRIHEDVASCLRELVERADAGEIVGVTVVSEHPDGTYGVTGSQTLSRLQTMGALLDAAIMRSCE